MKTLLKHGGLIAVALAMSCLATPVAVAQPGASSPTVAPPPGPPRSVPTPLPHEAKPDAWPYPEYVAEALMLTNLKTDDTFKAVRLQNPQRTGIDLLVLPVQTQAFGFTPAFRALVGAHLDRELVRRGVRANRQTEVFDGNGPFARRLDASAIEGFARSRPSSPMLGLYVGHDGADTTFLTLERMDAGTSKRAHRKLKLESGPHSAASVIGSVIPGLLAELGLGTSSTTLQPAVEEGVCSDRVWRLEVPDSAPDGLAFACHAIVMGTLLPEYQDRTSILPSAHSPAKLAWLASAYLVAEERATSLGTFQAIEALAWSQLGLDGASAGVPDVLQSPDPVVSRLGGLLLARHRSVKAPMRSEREGVERAIRGSAAGLPPFVGKVFVERGLHSEDFRPTDLCGLELALPGAMPGAKCREAGGAAPTKGRATPGELALYQEWRIAAFQKEVRYVGSTLGQAQRLKQLLASLPDDVARHPFVRQQRFRVEKWDAPDAKFDAYLAFMRASAGAFVQATADAQRYDAATAGYSISEHDWAQNNRVLTDPQVARLIQDEQRLMSVLRYDRFASTTVPASRRVSGQPATFLQALAPAPLREMPPSAPEPAQRRGGVDFDPVLPPSAAQMPVFGRGRPVPKAVTPAQLEARVAQEPTDMEARTALAMAWLKQGRPEAQARGVIDAQPADLRSDQQVSQSHTWAYPAHAFFFATDMDAAKRYYERVRAIGTGSGSDLHARGRLLQIAGDFPGTLAATEGRFRRYGGDFARRDLAGLLFMAGQPEPAWALVTPRLVSADTFQLWVGALVGQRAQKLDLAAVKAWGDRSGLKGTQINHVDTLPMYLHLHAVTDRVPSDDDITLLRDSGTNLFQTRMWVASARLMQMVARNDPTRERFNAARALLLSSPAGQSEFLKPLFTWAAWQATAGSDSELAAVRATELDSGDFDALLAKSMLLALEGKVAPSLEFLRAARYQMSELGLGSPNVDRAVPSPYHYAFAGHLMYVKTGNEAYRAEVLRFARAHQQMFPFWGWAYAAEALMERDEKRRGVAVCRARYLDPGSYFLSLVPPGATGRTANCPKGPWSAGR